MVVKAHNKSQLVLSRAKSKASLDKDEEYLEKEKLLDNDGHNLYSHEEGRESDGSD